MPDTARRRPTFIAWRANVAGTPFAGLGTLSVGVVTIAALYQSTGKIPEPLLRATEYLAPLPSREGQTGADS
ncbi:MAG TPA: hypothetical protein VNZ53_49760 [Steroidobacteraceae bacterium]|jgi:hypothetical protein|nr:hypothetical protein [Steroidobacteraceae bacterium]